MRIRALERREMRKCWPVYTANLFFSLSYAVVLYIHSSFLSQFFEGRIVSILFVIGAFGNLLFYLLSPWLLQTIGNKKFLLSLVVLSLISQVGLAFSTSLYAVVGFFILGASLPLIIYYSLDISLESVTTESITGEVRSIYMTLASIAIALSPLLVGFLAPHGEFQYLYLTSALLLIPLLLIVVFYFSSVTPKSHHITIDLPYKKWLKDRDIRRVTLARFTLEFFFVIMIIYTPLYLSQTLGFSWHTIGFIFSIMLLPFVLFEIPVGELADHWCGEKEIMTIGFFIMGLSLLIMPFLGPYPILWAGVLFFSRVGAAFTEVTTDVYFFKKVKSKDTGLIALFRLSRPLPIILGAVVGGISFSYLPPSAIFLILSIVVFLGMSESVKLRDTL